MEQLALAKIMALPFPDARKIWIARARAEARRPTTGASLSALGFERVDVPGDNLLTDDGREVLRAHGKAWALKPEIHAQRLAEAMEQVKQRDAANAEQSQQQTDTTCTALIDGQLCGGTLINAPVCPRCALGKSGVAATRTCDVCGHVTAVMRGDS